MLGATYPVPEETIGQNPRSRTIGQVRVVVVIMRAAPVREAGRGRRWPGLGQTVVPHIWHQNGRLAGTHPRQARAPGAADAEVLLGSDGAGAARHLRVHRNRREVAEPGLAGGTTTA